MEYDDKAKGQRKGKMVATHQRSVELKTAKTKRKRGQRLPLESEVRFNTSADLATDCVFLFDSELNCVEISKAALRLFPRGTKEKEVVGKHLLNISLGLKETDRYNKCLEVLKTGIPFFEDIIIPGPKFAGVRLAASVFRVNNGLGIAIKFATETEIEKLEDVGKELSEAEERYRSLAEDINDVVYILDDKAVITYVSPAIESILGYSASEMIGRPVHEYIYQEDWQLVMERFLTGSFPNIPGPFEFRVLTRSGEVRWVRNSPRTLIKQNRLIGYQGVLNDITDSKRALEDLKRSEQRFRSLVENAQDAIVILNPDATIRYESPSMAYITGRKAEERIGKNPLDFCYPDDIEKVVEEFIPLLENKVPVAHMELHLQHENDKLLDIELIGTNLIDDPAVGGIVLNLRDITERKRAEEALRISEEQFRILVETMNDGLAIQDHDGVMTFVNDKLCQMLGYASDELVGHTVMENLDEVNRKKYKEQMRKRRKGVIDPYEIEFIRKDGSRIISRISPQLITDTEGNMVGSFGIVTDITERKRLEEELRGSEEFSSSLLSNSPNPVLVLNPDTSVRYVNPALEKLTGFSKAELLNRRIPYPWWTKETMEKTSKELEEAMSEGADGLEILFQSKNGEPFWVQITSMPIRRQGELDHYLSNWVNITGRKRVEEELREKEERLSTFMESATDGFTLWDSELSLVEINKVAIASFPPGTKKEDVMGKNLRDLLPGDGETGRIKQYLEVIKTGEPFLAEDVVPHPIFGFIKVDVRAFKVGDGLGIVARDVTERNQVEEALQESEERFRSLVENAPYMIIISDREGKILFINYTTSGYSVEDTIGTSLYDYISVEHHDEVRRSVNGVFECGEPAAYEITGAGPDGTTSWYSTRLGPIKRDGHVIAVTHIASDITEHKQADEKLRESEEKIRLIFEAVTDAIVFSDLEGHIIDENEAALRIQGYSRVEEVIGKNGFDFIAEEDRARAIQSGMKTAVEGYGYISDVKFVSKDGREWITEGTASLVRDASGTPIGFVSSTRDITERKKAEEELLRASPSHGSQAISNGGGRTAASGTGTA